MIHEDITADMYNAADRKKVKLLSLADLATAGYKTQKERFDRLRQLRSRVEADLGVQLPVAIGIVNAPDLNGTAALGKDGRFILFWDGVADIARKLCGRVLSDPMFLPNSPGAAMENASRSIFQGRSDDHYQVVKYADYVSPLSDERNYLAQLLSDLVCDYAFFHELTHITNGHVGIIDAQHGLQAISEDEDILPPLDFIDYQTLEMDADSRAAYNIIAFIFHRATIAASNGSMQFRISASTPWPGADMMSGCMQVLYMLWKLTGRELNDSTIRPYKHPPSRVRMLIVKGMFAKIMRRDYGVDSEQAYVFFNRAVVEAELCFSRIFQTQYVHADHWGRMSGVYEQYTQRLLFNWNRLLPMLKPHVLGGRLAPVRNPEDP